MPRALHHPTRAQLKLEQVLHALGDPVRLALVRKLSSCPEGNPMNCSKMAEAMAALPLSSRHHHLRILREAGVIRSEKQGKEVLNTLRRTDLEAKFPQLLQVVLGA